MTQLTSKENPEIKRLACLISSRKERDETGLFVAEGLRICLDAVQSALEVETAYFSTSALQKYAEDCWKIMDRVPRWVELSDNLAGRLGDTKNPQGVFCLCRKPQNGALQVRENGRYLLLSSLQDPGNVGTIIRTADALELDGIVLSSDCPDLYSPKVLRATMGGSFRFPLWVTDDLPQAICTLRQQGVRILAAALTPEAQAVPCGGFSGTCGVVIGNEGNGLVPAVIDCCDGAVILPMAREGQSLNAAVAAGILMWELRPGS